MNEQSLYSVGWYEDISEEKARAILSDKGFEDAVARGAAYCEGRRGGWWQANNPEYYAAYACAARVAKGMQS